MSEHLETQSLLRASGELSPEEIAALELTLASDPEAAAFARFVERELPAAARAPRDFAAAAIASALPRRNIIAFPRLWKFAAAAAVLAAVCFLNQTPTQKPPPTSTTTRVSEEISARASAIEAEVADAHRRITHGRYSRQPKI